MWLRPTRHNKTCLFLLCQKPSRGRKIFGLLVLNSAQLHCTLSLPPLSSRLQCVWRVGVMDVAAVKVIARDWQQFSTSFPHKQLSAQRPDSRLKTSHYRVLHPSRSVGQFRRRRTRFSSFLLSTSSHALPSSSQVHHFTHDSAVHSQAIHSQHTWKPTVSISRLNNLLIIH